LIDHKGRRSVTTHLALQGLSTFLSLSFRTYPGVSSEWETKYSKWLQLADYV